MAVSADSVPTVSGNIETLRCPLCGWEAVFILPEEAYRVTQVLLTHLQQHNLVVPEFIGTVH